jgi:hypothetical protein
MKAIGCVALAAMVVLIGLIAAGAAAGTTKGMHGCGDIPRRSSYNIRADFSCKEARKVVWQWHGRRHYRNFECRLRNTGYESERARCSTANRHVRWIISA